MFFHLDFFAGLASGIVGILGGFVASRVVKNPKPVLRSIVYVSIAGSLTYFLALRYLIPSLPPPLNEVFTPSKTALYCSFIMIAFAGALHVSHGITTHYHSVNTMRKD